METRDFYLILGVGAEAPSQAVRTAYRQRVLGRPGRAPEAESLGDLMDAYRVLADPGLRASYDEARGVPVAVEGTPSQPEPLIPDQQLALTRDFEARDPTVDEVLDRLLRNFNGRNVPKSEGLDPLDLTIGVTPEMAALGGVLELAVPVFYPCPECRGEGYDGSYACFACGRTGMVEDTEPVHLRVPPLMADGSSFDIPLHGLGIENLYLRVHLRIGR